MSMLGESTVKTRFCPSPTGLMHLGNLRTALFNVLYAQKEKGRCLLRIEDTDAERSDARYVDLIVADMHWAQLPWEEGLVQGGELGPYAQSERQAIYDDYYRRLLAAGQAYPCFCTESELALQRKLQRSRGEPPRYAGICRNLTEAEREEKIAAGCAATLRFMVPQGRSVVFEDLVKGEQSFQADDIGDFIIRRSDGTAAFLFCNAVDDALMAVSHVFRGEDHLTNTPRQLMVLEALGLGAPTYGHIALIVGSDRRPLSKRHGSCSVDDFRREGYLPAAIVNYMARLGHYYPDDHLMTVEEMAAAFSVDRLARAPAFFDVQQLQTYQKQAVAALDQRGFVLWAGEGVLSPVPAEQQADFIDTIQPNVLFPEEVAQWVSCLFSDTFALSPEVLGTLQEIMHADYVAVARDFMAIHPLDYGALTAHLKTTLGLKGKALFMPLRLLLTGESRGPELGRVLSLLGKAEVERRLSRVSI